MSDLFNRFSGQEGRQITSANDRSNKAYIQSAQSNAPSAIRKQVIDLSSAPTNPLEIGFPMKAVYIYDASDASTLIQLRPFSNSENNDWVPLKVKDVLNFDAPINKCFLTWAAQPGKTLTIVFFTDANFTSGSFINQFQGDSGSSIQTLQSPINSATATGVVAQDTTRKKATFYNVGPATVWIGDFSVSPNNGIPIFPGDYYVYENSALLYGILDALAPTQNVNILYEY